MGIVIVENSLVTVHSHFRRNIITLCFAHDGMKQQPIDELQSALGNVFVSAVNRIPRLKSNDRAPPHLLKLLSQLLCCFSIGAESPVGRQAENLHVARKIVVSLIKQSRYAGVIAISGQIDLFRLLFLVVFEDVLN